MRYVLSEFVLLGLVGLLLIVQLAITAQPLGSKLIDVSWPNCQEVPVSQYKVGIVGVTGGLNFRPNPCLSSEISWFRRYALYLNSGYPGIDSGRKHMHTPLDCAPNAAVCLAYNYGYAAGKYALQAAARGGAASNVWFLDVETENSWTNSSAVNRAELAGELMAVSSIGLPVVAIGIYSTPTQWQIITGGWRNTLPEWLGTGQYTRVAALLGCRSPSFTGGPIWLSQYTVRLDTNVVCSSSLPGLFDSSAHS